MTNLWIPVAAAAFGAAGAVAAQIVSAAFTARRENARLKWEKERQDREWKTQESERFLHWKQELYSRYIQITYRPMMDTVGLMHREYTEEPGWHDRVPEYAGLLSDEIDELRWKIRLVGAQVVFERVEYSNAALLVAISEASRPDRTSLERRKEFAQTALSAWQDVSKAMRADLRGDEAALRQMWSASTSERPRRNKLSRQ